MTSNQASCLCGSGVTYQQCCAILHSGQAKASTAEALMRSRFTAYAMHNGDYLLQTWDTSTCPAEIDFPNDSGEWTQLEIVMLKKGATKDHKGIVEFKAFFTVNGEQRVMNEISRFIKKQNQWFYLDGKVKSIALDHGSFNQGLNAPCVCGSGKKFKRCCGKQ